MKRKKIKTSTIYGLIAVVGAMLAIILLIYLIKKGGESSETNSTTTTLKIECSIDSQCGTLGLTGNYECRGQSIFGEYKVYVCANQATPESKCVEIRTMEFLKNCENIGECINGVSDCEIRTTTTVYIPTEPSTKRTLPPYETTPTTRPTNVKCMKDSNCGFNHTSQRYCSNGHAVVDYIGYKCTNPGTYAARCSSEKTTYLVDYCGTGEICLFGKCRLWNWLSLFPRKNC